MGIDHNGDKPREDLIGSTDGKSYGGGMEIGTFSNTVNYLAEINVMDGWMNGWMDTFGTQ